MIKAHQHQLHQDLGVDHRARAFSGSNATLILWQPLLEFVVGLIFVAEAAHQAPATTADLQRIKRCLLRLGALHTDWHQDLQEILAAAVLSALLVISGETSFVASTDLMHFHARAEATRQRWHQLAEVHALFAQVMHRDVFAAQDGLHFHDLHRESHGLRLSTNSLQFSVHEAVAHGRPGIHVFHRCHAQDPAIGVERVILAARIVHIFKHFVTTDAL